MFVRKLFAGLLNVRTPLGQRCIRLSFWERLALLWTFRHFKVLPEQVLKPRQRRLLEILCANQRFVPPTWADDALVIGTVDRVALMRRPAVSSRANLAPAVKPAARRPELSWPSVPVKAEVPRAQSVPALRARQVDQLVLEMSEPGKQGRILA
jgi:hypothetical protein